ncbi:MAG: tetratricopeptide repeat protein, partial [Vicinamibacterales bacterium]
MPSCRLPSLVACLVLAASMAACGWGTSKEEYLASGDAFVQAGKNAEAVVEYRNAIALDNQYGDAR